MLMSVRGVRARRLYTLKTQGDCGMHANWLSLQRIWLWCSAIRCFCTSSNKPHVTLFGNSCISLSANLFSTIRLEPARLLFAVCCRCRHESQHNVTSVAIIFACVRVSIIGITIVKTSQYCAVDTDTAYPSASFSAGARAIDVHLYEDNRDGCTRGMPVKVFPSVHCFSADCHVTCFAGFKDPASHFSSRNVQPSLTWQIDFCG